MERKEQNKEIMFVRMLYSFDVVVISEILVCFLLNSLCFLNIAVFSFDVVVFFWNIFVFSFDLFVFFEILCFLKCFCVTCPVHIWLLLPLFSFYDHVKMCKSYAKKQISHFVSTCENSDTHLKIKAITYECI